MRAEIISIGDELTSGQRLDTNSQWLAERLGEIGVPVAFHTTVSDNLEDNVLVFRHATQRAEVVVATGGLGPTADDLTRQAISDLAGVPLVEDGPSLAHIKSLFARRKREMPPANLVQAMFPAGSRPIPNPHGTAPGIEIAIPHGQGPQARIFALPGVPAEMREMWAASVRPAIQQMLGVTKTLCHYRIKCFGVGESDLEAMLPDLIARNRYPIVGITVHHATITLRITAEGPTRAAALASMEPTIATIRDCLKGLIFGYEEDELQDVVVHMLAKRTKTLALAEWGTGGLISHWLHEAGATGDVLKGAVVTCSADAAKAMLPGDPFFPTDEAQWTAALAAGVRNRFGADYGLAIGRIPEADSRDAAAVHFALAHAGGTVTRQSPIAGHPEIVKPRAAKQALNLLRLYLLENE